MKISKKINELKKHVIQIDQLVEDLILSLESQKRKIEKKDEKIFTLKEEIKKNVDKIEKILEDYKDANL